MYIDYIKNKNEQLFQNLKDSDYKSWEMSCNILFNFFDENLIITSIISELKQNSYYKNDWNYINQGSMGGNVNLNLPNTEIEMAALSLKLLEGYSQNFRELRVLSHNMGDKKGIDSFHKIFTKSLKIYIENKLDEGNLVLYLLNKYKCHCEWFTSKELMELYEKNTGSGEKLLTKDLQKFLFDNGIDYPFSEPVTPSGKPDLVHGINTNNPLTLEIKLFGGKSNYGKNYIKKGFNQAISYANDYNKLSAYLLIFNLSNSLLEFKLKCNEEPLHINYNNKTVFIVIVNLNINNESASKSKKDIIVIDEDFLVN